MTATDLPIRLARAAFNTALAQGDLAAIGPLLTADCVLVTGTDSAVLAGRKAQVRAWQQEFAASPRTIYQRTPEAITASPIAPMAMETGRWQGTANGAVIANGTYCAKWRQVDDKWMIEAEIYLTLA